jgi:hypothetical protein
MQGQRHTYVQYTQVTLPSAGSQAERATRSRPLTSRGQRQVTANTGAPPKEAVSVVDAGTAFAAFCRSLIHTSVMLACWAGLAALPYILAALQQHKLHRPSTSCRCKLAQQTLLSLYQHASLLFRGLRTSAARSSTPCAPNTPHSPAAARNTAKEQNGRSTHKTA